MIRWLLERASYTVVGTTVGGLEAVEMAHALRPAVILMDLELPHQDGIAAARQIQENCPTPVVVMTAYDTPELVARASNVGVGAYLVKPPDKCEVARAITIAIARFDDLMALRWMEASLRQAQTELAAHAEGLEQKVTEKVRELEMERAKVLQAGKLAALGEMATGMAHELNQPLTSMLFDAEYLKTMAQQAQATESGVIPLGADELCQLGNDIVGDIGRCRRSIDHLRPFARVSKEEARS